MRRHFYSPAMAILAKSRLTQNDIAKALGISQELVSLSLKGERPLHPGLLRLVRAMAPEVADEFERALPKGPA